MRMPLYVIPGRAEGANPESRHRLRVCFWIPDRRFAASGMTGDSFERWR
ncbi:MAG: hypothetical protein QOD25_3838 [Alphaproteobacteria bacterium]|nr:hypothetical protein [Alphaproteobacteria bacterium]